MKLVSQIQNYKNKHYIVEQTGEILDGWPNYLNPNEYGFIGYHREYIVIIYRSLFTPFPFSNVTPVELYKWKKENGFNISGYRKELTR